MTLLEYYLQYLGELAEHRRPTPDGMVLTETDEAARAAQMQAQVEKMGLEAFVKVCAAQDGMEIAPHVFDDFDPTQMTRLLSQLGVETEPEQMLGASRCAYEVLLDCCCLEDNLMQYLIALLKDCDEKGFWRLAQVCTRTDMRIEDFLHWLATLQNRAGDEAGACARLMDACFDRLCAAGELELMAGLLAGDRVIFETFRCEAPELLHIPAATFSWFERNYLDSYFPFRAILKSNGIVFS